MKINLKSNWLSILGLLHLSEHKLNSNLIHNEEFEQIFIDGQSSLAGCHPSLKIPHSLQNQLKSWPEVHGSVHCAG